MTWFDRRREKPPQAFRDHAGVVLLRGQGHEVNGDFDTQTISVDGLVMTCEGFEAFVKGYALGRLDERTGK